jgi:hypothetical protein
MIDRAHEIFETILDYGVWVLGFFVLGLIIYDSITSKRRKGWFEK